MSISTTGPERRLLPNQRHLFDIPDEVAYFDCANQAPQLRSVRAAAEQALTRGAAPWTIGDDDWFVEVEELRTLFARLIGADTDGIAVIPATSYGLAVAAHNVRGSKGDRVLLIADDYPSNVHTWRAWARRTDAEIYTVGRDEGQSWTAAILEALDERVRVVSVPNVHWIDGALIELPLVGERAREVGAVFVVDATQSLGALPLEVSAVRPDYLVASGYKWLLGPLSVAYMFVAEKYRSGRPIEENWINRAASEDAAGLTDYRDDYRPGARRFDVGQRTNFTLVPMAIAALRQILRWHVESIAASLARTTSRIEHEAALRGLAVLSADRRGPHLLGIPVPANRRARIGQELGQANVFVGMRGWAMRVSPHLHATESDVDRLFQALDRVWQTSPAE
jgi:selenocysteine lyase/cysteine desulfurase